MMIRLFAIVLTMGWAVAALGAPASGTIDWKTATLEFKLAAPAKGMGLLGIRHLGQGVEFLKRPAEAGKALLWRVELTPDRRKAEALIVLDNTSAAGGHDVQREGNGLVLTWRQVALPANGGTLDVTVRADGHAPEGFTNWRIDVANHSSRYGIWRVIFPVMELGRIGDSGGDDYLICSPDDGRSVRNPIGLDAVERKDRVDTDLYTDNTPVVIKGHMSAEFGFGAARPNGLPYPSARGQMQLSAYYQKGGNFYFSNPSKGPGLYFTPEDGQSYPKIFFYTPDARRGVLTYEMANFPQEQGKPGLSYHMAYPMVIGGFEGDWYDATQIYRKWALHQPWAAKGPLASRRDIPDWLKRQVGTFRLNVKVAKNELVMPPMVEARKLLPGIWGAQWYDWSSAEKGDAKGYALPPVADAPEGFGSLVAQLQGMGFAVFPYANTQLWRESSPGYAEASKYVMRLPNGAPAGTNYGAFRMCLQTDFWQEYLAKTCAEIVRRYHPQGLYLDQAGEVHFGGTYDENVCFDPAHGHPLGINHHLVQAEHDRLAAILTAGQKIEPQLVLTGEGSAENFMDVIANHLIHYEIWPGYVPLFSAVYHDYMTFYGRTASVIGRNPADPIPQMQIGWQLVLGDQIGRVWQSSFSPKNLKNPIVQRNLDYLKRAALVREKWPEFFCLGRMLRPPHLIGEAPVVVTHEFRKKQTCSLPGILASVWESADGQVALVVTNISDKPLEARLGLEPAVIGQASAQEVFPTTAPAAVERKKDEVVVTIPLKPLEIRVVRWDGE